MDDMGQRRTEGGAEEWRRGMSIGESLAETRRRAGLSVYEVSRQTRVREPIIRGIEQDDYSACGGGFYPRGHTPPIAPARGADPPPRDPAHHAPGRAPD